MKRIIITLSAIGLIITSGCYYDKEDLLYGSNCDTTNTKYSTTVRTLFTNYGCMGCHAGIYASGGINLEPYANVKALVDNGRLYGSITHSAGFKPMPDGAAKMTSCDIQKIKSWIDTGAPNN